MDGEMRFTLPYRNEYITFELDEGSVVFSGEMGTAEPLPDLRAATVCALKNPIAAPALAELASGKNNILFLVEDNTRETPLDKILPIAADYLNLNGVGDERITLMAAPGTHRLMTEPELLKKFGEVVMSRFKIYQHDATDAKAIADLGSVEVAGYSVPLRVNRRVLDADLLVGFGCIIPHCNAGFSGGAKILIPGASDFATTSAIHAAAVFHPRIPLGENGSNPCRRAIEAGAVKAGLDFIFNVVLNKNGEVAAVFAGDFVKAHRAGSALAAELYKIRVPECADIVIVSSYPAEQDFWQAGKALTAASLAVKDGGIIILAAPCIEGLAHNHPRYREYLRLGLDENISIIKNSRPGDERADVVAAAVASENCKIRERAGVFIITEGLSEEDVSALGFVRFKNMKDALAAALSIKPDATFGVIPEGGRALPVLQKNGAE